MTLRLTKEQKHALAEHEPPQITGDGQCPVKKGDVVKVYARLSIRVDSVNRRRKGGWALQYTVMDSRDPARIMKRTPKPLDYDELRKEFDEDGYPVPLSEDVIRQAARESAYSSAPSSLSDAGEAVDEQTQNRLTKEAAQRLVALKGEELGRKDLRSSLERLKRLAKAQGSDSSAAAIVKSHIEQIERELRDRAA